MAKIRIATFNVENLLRRFDFGRGKEPALELLNVTNEDEALELRKSLHVFHTDEVRQMCAQAIREIDADIICMQEVDNRAILDDFHYYYLKGSAGLHYGWRRLLEGNDNRGIDVAAMAKERIDVVSHANHTFDDFGLFNAELNAYGLSPGDHIFRRDCLEVKHKVGGKDLYLFVCHFKSMSGGRAETRCVREAEASAVRRIIEDKFGANASQEYWMVLGDFNDYLYEYDGTPVADHGLGALVTGGFSVNLMERLNPEDRWTHYFSRENSFHQIDHLMVSQALADKNKAVKPEIFRKGQPWRVPGYEKLQRYPRVGFDRPKASDHCPVAVTLNV